MFCKSCGKLISDDSKLRNLRPEMEIKLNSEYHLKPNPIIDSSLKDMLEINKNINSYNITFTKILGARIHELIRHEITNSANIRIYASVAEMHKPLL